MAAREAIKVVADGRVRLFMIFSMVARSFNLLLLVSKFLIETDDEAMDTFWAECCGFSECVNALKSLLEVGYVSVTPTCSVMPNSHSNLDTGEDDFVVDQPLVKKRRLELSQCRGNLCGLLARACSRPRDFDCLHSQMFAIVSVDVRKPDHGTEYIRFNSCR